MTRCCLNWNLKVNYPWCLASWLLKNLAMLLTVVGEAVGAGLWLKVMILVFRSVH